MTACENLEFTGDGFRADYVDDTSLLLNPKIFEVQRNRVEPGIHYTNYENPSVLVSTGTYSWECTFEPDMVNTPNRWVDCAYSLYDAGGGPPGFDGDGKLIEVRFRAKGTGSGAILGYLGWAGSPGWTVNVAPSDDWVEYVSPLMLGVGAYSRLLFTGVSENAFIEFELMHVAYITRKETYTVN
jgi:hypothetical protein